MACSDDLPQNAAAFHTSEPPNDPLKVALMPLILSQVMAP